MTQVISIDTKIAKDILSALHELKEQVAHLNEKMEGAPLYGSDEWWKWSDKKAQEDINSGRVVKLDSAEEAIKWLNS